MELIYSAMLLHKAGKEITEENVKKVLDSIGVQKEDGEIKALCAAMADVDIDKAIKEAAVPVAVAPTDDGGGEKKEEKEEEAKEEPEKAAAGLSNLFGD